MLNRMLCALLFSIGLSVSVWADEIYLTDASEPVAGQIKSATYEEIKLTLPGVSRAQTYEASRVRRIVLSGNSQLRTGYGRLEAGEYNEAVIAFKRAAGGREGVIQASGMYGVGLAYAAWGRVDPKQNAEAISAFDAFTKAYAGEKSYWLPLAYLKLADVYIRSEKPGDAESALAKISGMGDRWDLAKQLKSAEVQLAKGEFDAAKTAFLTLAAKSEVKGDDELSAWAHLGTARSQFGKEQYSGVVDTIRGKLLVAGSRRPARLDTYAAQGFILWGRAEEASAGGDATKQQFAVLRYLRAASIASTGGEDYAEALYHAAALCAKLGQTGRAEELKRRLLKNCPRSPWAKK